SDTRDLVRWLSPAARSVTAFLTLLGADPRGWDRAVLDHGQIKPEHLINLNSLGIITLQVAISVLARRWKPLTTIICGVIVTGLSFCLHLLGTGGAVVVLAVLTFSIGE